MPDQNSIFRRNAAAGRQRVANKSPYARGPFRRESKMARVAHRLHIVGVASVCGLSIGFNASAASSAADLIGGFQNLCDVEHGYTTFTKQVACIKSEIASTGYKSDPHVQLYVFTADKLVEDVDKRRLSSPAARLELQKAYLELARTEKDEASIVAEKERSQQEAIDRKERDQSAIRNCISRATARVMSVAVNDSSLLPQLMLVAPNRQAVEANCARDPRWYESLPMPRRERVSQCEADGLGGLTCTTK
jgi:hypothetical protein